MGLLGKSGPGVHRIAGERCPSMIQSSQRCSRFKRRFVRRSVFFRSILMVPGADTIWLGLTITALFGTSGAKMPGTARINPEAVVSEAACFLPGHLYSMGSAVPERNHLADFFPHKFKTESRLLKAASNQRSQKLETPELFDERDHPRRKARRSGEAVELDTRRPCGRQRADHDHAINL